MHMKNKQYLTNLQFLNKIKYLLVCKLIRYHKQVNSGQACSCAQVGDLHAFIRVPVYYDKY